MSVLYLWFRRQIDYTWFRS